MKPLHVTFLLAAGGSAQLSGGARIIAEYAARLQERGHTVRLIAPARPRPPPRRIVKSLMRLDRLPERSPRPSGHLSRPGLDVRILKTPPPLMTDQVPDADVVIATWWETAEWAAALPTEKGAKVYLVQDHEVFPHLPVERAARTYGLPLHKIVVSRWLQETMRDVYGDSDVSLIPNAVDTDIFSTGTRAKSEGPTIGFLYTRSERKNVRLAIEAMEIAKRDIPGLRGKSFGSVEPDNDLPLPTWIDYHHRPSQEAIPGIYAACDTWLFTSESEGFGLPILEAMACGTPVLATPAGAAPELVTEATGALLPSDPEAFGAAIGKIAQMADTEWLKLSVHCKSVAHQHDWQSRVNAFEKVLYEVAERSSCS